MPDYEIRYFNSDGSLSVVRVSHHLSDEEAHSHARRMKGEHARYEIRRGGERLPSRKS